MEAWNHIITTAILGTDKRSLKTEDLPADLAGSIAEWQQQQPDKEDQFLQAAAVVFNYRQCGCLPVRKDDVHFAKADAETKTYCSEFASRVLHDILETDNLQLLQLWLQACQTKDQIVHPEVIPVLFEKAAKQRSLQKEVMACSGKRGEWLLSMNDEWEFQPETVDEAVWNTGTIEQRKAVLRETRKEAAEKGREWLKQVWSQENAANKVALLSALEVKLGKDDEPWIEGLLTEKSVKVKEAAWQLLKTIPDSNIVQQYWNVLRQSIQVKKEKGIFGFGSKVSLEIDLSPVDEKVFQSGIEKLSSSKEISDEEYILYQLVQQVPPFYWEQHFQLPAEEIVIAFHKNKQGVKLLPAFADAIQKFHDERWAVALAKKSDSFFQQLLTVLPVHEWEAYCKESIETYPADILHSALQTSYPWSHETAKQILKYTAQNGYQYHRAFYSSIIHLLPASIVQDLESCTPAEVYQKDMWRKNSEFIGQLLTLKINIHKAFHS